MRSDTEQSLDYIRTEFFDKFLVPLAIYVLEGEGHSEEEIMTDLRFKKARELQVDMDLGHLKRHMVVEVVKAAIKGRVVLFDKLQGKYWAIIGEEGESRNEVINRAGKSIMRKLSIKERKTGLIKGKSNGKFGKKYF